MSSLAWLSALYKYQASNYIHVACIALVVFDHLDTLPLEVEYAWSSPLTIVNTLYYITRYSLFIDSAIVAYRQFAPNLNPERCRISMWILAFEYCTSVWVGEAILGLKVWSVWLRDWRLTLAMPIAFAALSVPGMIGLFRYLKSVRFDASTPFPRIVSCPIASENTDISWNMVGVTIWTFLMFILLLIPAIREYKSRGSSSKFVKMVYREGMMYYFYFFIFSSGSLLVEYKGPPGAYVGIISFPARFFQVAALSRILLHTRQQASRRVIFLDVKENA